MEKKFINGADALLHQIDGICSEIVKSDENTGPILTAVLNKLVPHVNDLIALSKYISPVAPVKRVTKEKEPEVVPEPKPEETVDPRPKSVQDFVIN